MLVQWSTEMCLFHISKRTLGYIYTFISKLPIMDDITMLNIKSSVESQKGVNTIQHCSVENQKGASAVQSLWEIGSSALLVLNRTPLNSVSALLALS